MKEADKRWAKTIVNMNPQRVDFIVAKVVVLADSAAPRAYVDRACAGDAELCQEVESLLAAHDQTGEFLETALTVVMEVGTRIGPFGREAMKPADAGTIELL